MMNAARKPIPIVDESDLVRLLDDAPEEPVFIERRGVVYRLARVDETEDIWANYDPERSRRILHDMAGSISQEEAEVMKDLIYRARKEGTRQANRP